MDYYDKLIDKIESLLDSDKKKALSLIEDELKLPYVPRDALKKLTDIKNSIYIENESNNSIDEILSFLYQNDEKQMLASFKLDDINLRQYIEQISLYLKSDGLLEAKLNIVVSLIKQEIDKELIINKEGYEYSFNPINLKLIEESDAYLYIKKLLNEHYMKNPDKLALACDLLYTELFYLLPCDTSNVEFNEVFKRIVNTIEDSFK